MQTQIQLHSPHGAQALTKLVYRIEPNPGGGFIARSADPKVAPLEAPTREELQQKIQAKIFDKLGTELSAMKLPADGQPGVAVQVERKPGMKSVFQTGSHVRISSPKLNLTIRRPQSNSGLGMSARDSSLDENFSGNANVPITPERSSTIYRLVLGLLALAALAYFFLHQ
jgi:hypothetical protein